MNRASTLGDAFDEVLVLWNGWRPDMFASILTEILIIGLLVLINGVFALSEMAIVSARKTRLQQQARKGQPGARAALKLASEPTRFLSTVQIGITLVGILAGAFGGATLAEQLADRLRAIPVLAPYSEAIGVAVVVVAISYLSLVIGELVPKRLALANPEQIAAAVAIPMRTLATLASPAVQLLSVSTNAILKVLVRHPPSEQPVSEEEIKILIEQGARSGVFETVEQEIVESVFRLADRRVGALMTPRTEIVWLDLSDSPEEIERQVAASDHSRFPVGQERLDNVVGVVRGQDVLAARAGNRPLRLESSLAPPLFVPESLRVLALLEAFRQEGQHLALVIDEHGGLQGLVTAHDILEALVGEMPVSGALAEKQAFRREDGSWLLDGLLLIDEFKEIFNFDPLPDEEHIGFQTLGGFVLAQFGDIPAPGASFNFQGYRFEVVAMDGHRVDKVTATPREAPRSATPNDGGRPAAGPPYF